VRAHPDRGASPLSGYIGMKFHALAEQRRIIAYLGSVKQQTTEPQTIQKENRGFACGDENKSFLRRRFEV
jgi:hypothetical protein